jgi:hypothetical protein
MSAQTGLTINQVYNMLTTEGAVAMAQKNVSINNVRDKPAWTDRNWYDRYGSLTLAEDVDPTVLGSLTPAPWEWFSTLPTGIAPEIITQAQAIQLEVDTFVRTQSPADQAIFLSKLARWVDALSKNLPQ